LDIHIWWKVPSEARMEPPIHTPHLRRGRETRARRCAEPRRTHFFSIVDGA
jgi:hypothetical protein